MKQIFFFLLPLLAIVGLLTPASGSADIAARTGAVVGIVTAHGAPAAGVAVMIEVQVPGGRNYTAHTRTDHAGRYGFRHVPAGHGIASARDPRGLHGSERFALHAGTVERVHISLHR
ncbi:MAG: carboxypeptidase-like regulatory domain-containing protein [Planctomycetota bacterium]|nr:carboxypeptidase-like regulatory domain-containing protein [Planctomycetota bacterium]